MCSLSSGGRGDGRERKEGGYGMEGSEDSVSSSKPERACEGAREDAACM